MRKMSAPSHHPATCSTTLSIRGPPGPSPNLCPCTPQICGSNGSQCRGTLLQVTFLTRLHLCDLLSFRKLPRLFKPSHCQLLRHHAQLVAVQFYAMQLVITRASSSLKFVALPFVTSQFDLGEPVSGGAPQPPHAQLRVPAHFRSASAMALRAGALSQRLHFPNYAQVLTTTLAGKLLLHYRRPQLYPNRVHSLQHLQQPRHCPSPARCPNSFAFKLPRC